MKVKELLDSIGTVGMSYKDFIEAEIVFKDGIESYCYPCESISYSNAKKILYINSYSFEDFISGIKDGEVEFMDENCFGPACLVVDNRGEDK